MAETGGGVIKGRQQIHQRLYREQYLSGIPGDIASPIDVYV